MTRLQKKRIAIVGAGPAGSAAGFHLAVRGHAVTLFDREAFPRDKTCGDWLTPAAMAELAILGLDGAALALRAPGHAIVSRTLLASPDGRTSERAAGRPGACVARRRLDFAVRECALRAGCVPARRTFRHIAVGAGTDLAAFDLAIDARGAIAGASNAIGLRGYWTVPRAAVADDAVRRVEIHTDDAFRRGYGWVFPVQVDANSACFNIGVGLWKDDSAAGHSVADYLDRFLAGNGVARALCDAATECSRPVGYPVALGLWRNRVARRGVLRIGDAANLADPLTGDGIGNALKSGRLVAEVLSGHADTAAATAHWQRAFDKTFAPELRRALVLRQLLLSTTAKNLATRILERGLPSFGSRLHRAVFGETEYRDLWRGGAGDGQRSMPPNRS